MKRPVAVGGNVIGMRAGLVFGSHTFSLAAAVEPGAIEIPLRGVFR